MGALHALLCDIVGAQPDHQPLLGEQFVFVSFGSRRVSAVAAAVRAAGVLVDGDRARVPKQLLLCAALLAADVLPRGVPAGQGLGREHGAVASDAAVHDSRQIPHRGADSARMEVDQHSEARSEPVLLQPKRGTPRNEPDDQFDCNSHLYDHCNRYVEHLISTACQCLFSPGHIIYIKLSTLFLYALVQVELGFITTLSS